MLENSITPDEILYRRILANKGLYEIQPDKRVLFFSQAFAERTFRPSVERAKKCENNPRHTLGPHEDAGVTSLVTRDIQGINDLIQYDSSGRNRIQTYSVDVEYKPIINEPPLPDNDAHSEIYTLPPCSRGVFKRLCERLALLANARQWEIKPPDL
jgi:hypothetical protein